NSIDSLHLTCLKPELVLTPETEWCAVIDVERLTVHLVSEQRHLMLHVAKSVDVVITPSVLPVGVAVEYRILRTRVRFHPFRELCHRGSTPLGNAAPALNAVVLRDLFTETDPAARGRFARSRLSVPGLHHADLDLPRGPPTRSPSCSQRLAVAASPIFANA